MKPFQTFLIETIRHYKDLKQMAIQTNWDDDQTYYGWYHPKSGFIYPTTINDDLDANEHADFAHQHGFDTDRLFDRGYIEFRGFPKKGFEIQARDNSEVIPHIIKLIKIMSEFKHRQNLYVGLLKPDGNISRSFETSTVGDLIRKLESAGSIEAPV